MFRKEASAIRLNRFSRRNIKNIIAG